MYVIPVDPGRDTTPRGPGTVVGSVASIAQGCCNGPRRTSARPALRHFKFCNLSSKKVAVKRIVDTRVRILRFLFPVDVDSVEPVHPITLYVLYPWQRKYDKALWVSMYT